MYGTESQWIGGQTIRAQQVAMRLVHLAVNHIHIELMTISFCLADSKFILSRLKSPSPKLSSSYHHQIDLLPLEYTHTRQLLFLNRGAFSPRSHAQCTRKYSRRRVRTWGGQAHGLWFQKKLDHCKSYTSWIRLIDMSEKH